MSCPLGVSKVNKRYERAVAKYFTTASYNPHIIRSERMIGMEIERKYRVRMRPEHLEMYSVWHMTQGYICTEPVIRVRSIRDDKQELYVLTVKGNGLVEREEFELTLTKEQYERLCQKVDGYVIEKKRYRIPLGGDLVAELDEFLGRLQGLWLVEVEFKSREAMAKFTPPQWFGEDVSDDGTFQNSRLSRMESYC